MSNPRLRLIIFMRYYTISAEAIYMDFTGKLAVTTAGRLTEMKLKENASRIKRSIPALYLALRHEKTPPAAKIMAALTVAYALSPIDLIPDFIPILGYLDDLILLPLMAALTVKLIPPEIMEECTVESAKLWQNGRPKK